LSPVSNPKKQTALAGKALLKKKEIQNSQINSLETDLMVTWSLPE